MSRPRSVEKLDARAQAVIDSERDDLLALVGATLAGWHSELRGHLPASKEVDHGGARCVLRAVEHLDAHDEPVSNLTVVGQLRRSGALEQLTPHGGERFLQELVAKLDSACLTTPADVQRLAKRVRAGVSRRSLARELVHASESLRVDEDLDEVRARLRRTLDDNAGAGSSDADLPTVRIADVVDTGPPAFLIGGLLLDMACAIVGGDPKSLKSFFTVWCALHVALGRPLFGRHPVKRGRVLIYNAEDQAALTRFRVAGMCRALGVSIADADIHLVAAPSLFLDNPADVDRLRRTVDRLKPTLLILDPLRNLHGLDENDSEILPLVLQPLRVIQREHGCAVVVVHHLVKVSEGRTAASRLRGTGALRGWYDSGLILDRTEEGGPIKITVEHRGAVAPEPFRVELNTSTTQDGDAFWFEQLGAPAGADASFEELVLAFKSSNPGMPGRKALDQLRAQGLKFRNDDFWEFWK